MNAALILSGGTGTRLGADIPKQYIEVCGKPVISYCIRQISGHDRIDAVQIVADEIWRERLAEWMADEGMGSKFKGFSMPGRNRQMSVLNGLEDIRRYAEAEDYVLIHDAARPLVSRKQITDCLDAAKGHDGAVPVLPMKDTIYLSVDGKKISSLLNRSEVFAGQAPEVFVLGRYLDANRKLLPDGILKINGSTEPAVMAGMEIAMIPGDEGNFKVTTKADLERFRELAGAFAREEM